MWMAAITPLAWGSLKISEINGSNLPIGLIAVAVIVWLTLGCLRGGFSAAGRLETNITANSLGLGVLSIAAAIWWTNSVAVGLAIVVGIAIHEYGHVAAFRAMGHTDARFRLVPFLGGVAISRKIPRDQLSDFYIVFMGPGIMLAPLAISGFVSAFTSGQVSYYAGIMFMVTGAINFFNLLPFWPLDGGRMMRVLLYTVSPWIADRMTMVMSLGLAAFAAYAGYYLIMVVAFLGMRPAMDAGKISRRQDPLTADQAVMGTIAYGMMAAAHGLAGWPLIANLLRLN